jgi:hypothetical protein
MSFAGVGNPPQSPPGRGGHCAPAGGYMRKERAEQRPAWEQRKYSSIGILGGSEDPGGDLPASGLPAGFVVRECAFASSRAHF